MKTKNIRTGMLAALAAIGLAACGDPWSGENKADPKVVRVIAQDPAALGASDPTGSSMVTSPDASGTWLLTGVDPVAAVINVQANKLLDGATIQAKATATDCTPAAGAFTFSPPPPAGATWYTCLAPSSGNTDQGATIMIYAGTDQADPGSALSFPAGTLVTITGAVKDHLGKSMPIDVKVQY
jgi:hypothetical protein